MTQVLKLAHKGIFKNYYEPDNRCPRAAAVTQPPELLLRPTPTPTPGRLARRPEAAPRPWPPWSSSASPEQLSFTLASPTQVFFNGLNVRQLDMHTQTGAFGLLAGHVPPCRPCSPSWLSTLRKAPPQHSGETSRTTEALGCMSLKL